ncbi:lytic transglycosylase F [Betaproteobacteria bacterium GR16-43]|nr:lytic transglycosylase F [Betaproteobacteria bacterium GR16-43]
MLARRLLVFLACLASGCDVGPKPIGTIDQAGELVVLTVNGPATYFEDAEGHASGFEYDLVTLFAKDLGVKVRFVLADDVSKIEPAIKAGRAHLAAAALVRQLDLPGGTTWGPSYFTAQHVVVYRTAEPKPKSLVELSGKRVGVVEESYADSLLMEPPKLSVPIERLPPGTPTGDLLQQLVDGKLDYALMESTRFTLLRKHFPQLDTAFDVGKPVDHAWLVASIDKDRILGAARPFFERVTKDGTLKRLVDRHYGHVKSISVVDASTFLERIDTTLPALRGYFIEAERASGVDWRLLAAIGYQESHWDPKATSPTGVRGLMMLTEDTAQRLQVKDRLDARESILGGARYLVLMKDNVPQRIPEPDRTYLALAAYNVGMGHLEDARILAQRSGLDPDQWQNVRFVLKKLADPKIYPTLKHGYARGYETLDFVDNIRNYRDIIDRLSPRDTPLIPRPAVLEPVQSVSKSAPASR